MTMHGAVVITNGDNEDEPNVMYGDILTSFYPRESITEGLIQFPVWRSINITTPPIGNFRLPLSIDPDRGSEVPVSLFVDYPDQLDSVPIEPRVEHADSPAPS